MLAIYIVAGVILSALAIVGAFFGTLYVLKRREEADLERYLQDENCKWERMHDEDSPEGSVVFRNTEPESSGIEMRAYYFTQLPEDAEDEGVCLSIIDPERSNGMILNGFGRALDAMEFGDGLWNDQFLGDAGIMERTIEEKRVAWDQMQREVIIAHYSLYM